MTRRVWSGIVALGIALSAAGCGEDGGAASAVDGGVDAVAGDTVGVDVPPVGVGAVTGAVVLFGRDDHAGVTVSVGAASATTGADGAFSISGLSAGFVTVRLDHPDFAPETREVLIAADDTVTLAPVTLRAGRPIHLGESAWPVTATPDGRFILYMAPYSPMTVSGDLWVWDDERDSATLLAANVPMHGLAGTPDGSLLAFLSDISFATGLGTLHVWDAESGEVHELAHDVSLQSLRFGPGYVVWLAEWDGPSDLGTLTAWRPGDAAPTVIGRNAAIFGDGLATAHGLYFLADVDATTRAGALRRWSPAAPDAPAETLASGVWRDFWSFDPDAWRLLYMTAVDATIPAGTLHALDLTAGTSWTLGASALPYGMIEDRARGGVLFVTDYEPLTGLGTLRAFDFDSGAVALVAERVAASYLFPSLDGRWVYWFADYDAAQDSGDLGLWDFESGAATTLSDGVRTGSVTVAADGSRYAWLTAFAPGPETGDLWTWAPGEAAPRLVATGARRWLMQLSPDGAWLVWRKTHEDGSMAGDAWLWSAASGESVRLSDDSALAVWFLDGARTLVYVHAFDGPTLAGDVVARRLATGAEAVVATGMPGNLQVTLDGRHAAWVASAQGGSPGTIWALTVDPDGTAWARELAEGVEPWSFAFSPNGSALAWLGASVSGGGGATGTLGLWGFDPSTSPSLLSDVASWEGVLFSADGRWLRFTTELAHPFAGVWMHELATGASVRLGEDVNLQAMAFAPELDRAIVVASCEGDLGTVVRWDAGSPVRVIGQAAAWFSVRPSPDLSAATWLTDFAPTSATGTLWAWTEAAGARALDAPVALSVVSTEQGQLYAVVGSSDDRDGLWWTGESEQGTVEE